MRGTALVRWWIALWDRREPPDVLVLVRIGVGLVFLYDLFVTWRLGLVTSLMATTEHDGLASASPSLFVPWLEWVGGDPASAHWLHRALVISALSLVLGFCSRTSAALLMLLSAEWALVLPDSDRAIDVFLRNVLMILAFSGCGKKWSLDAWLSTGRPRETARSSPQHLAT